MSHGIESLEAYLQAQPKPLADARKLRDQVYQRLADALRNVDLEPGLPLPETRLSQALEVSRTPVREALQLLAADGLIQINAGRAFTLAARPAQELFDALRVRELLEPEVIRLAAQTLSPKHIQRLQELTQEMAQVAERGDRPVWSRLDREWHEILSNACPNQLLGQMVLQARNRMQQRGSDDHVIDQYLIDGTREHQAIVDAIAERDADTARQRMAHHLEEARENMFRKLIGR